MTDDPEAWPHSPSTDPAAEAVRQIARDLAGTLADRGWSLRRTADGSGVNRQAIADLLAGRSWPDIATVARLAAFTGTALWPTELTIDRKTKH
jgi:transcriptional regulator with XRE-family HTH domain